MSMELRSGSRLTPTMEFPEDFEDIEKTAIGNALKVAENILWCFENHAPIKKKDIKHLIGILKGETL